MPVCREMPFYHTNMRDSAKGHKEWIELWHHSCHSPGSRGTPCSLGREGCNTYWPLASLCDSEKTRRASGTHTCSSAHYKLTTLSKDFMNAVKVPIFKRDICYEDISHNICISMFTCIHNTNFFGQKEKGKISIYYKCYTSFSLQNLNTYEY